MTADAKAEPKSFPMKNPAYLPSADEQQLMQQWLAKPDRLPRVTLRMDGDMYVTGNDHQEQAIGAIALVRALGLGTMAHYSMFVGQALSMCNHARPIEAQAKELNEFISTVVAQEPRDITEAMLCLQMAGIHFAATGAIASMRNNDSLEVRVEMGTLASKLTRTFTMQVEALKKHRTKGKPQTVLVEHKHYNVAPGAVSPGAQAVFGDVSTGDRGGVDEKTKGQSHERTEPVRIPERPPVLSVIEADRLPMQGARVDRQERLPVPRRQSGGTDRAA